MLGLQTREAPTSCRARHPHAESKKKVLTGSPGRPLGPTSPSSPYLAVGETNERERVNQLNFSHIQGISFLLNNNRTENQLPWSNKRVSVHKEDLISLDANTACAEFTGD